MSSLATEDIHFLVSGDGTRDEDWVATTPVPISYANLPHPTAFKVMRVPPSPKQKVTPIVRIFPTETQLILVDDSSNTHTCSPKSSVPNVPARTPASRVEPPSRALPTATTQDRAGDPDQPKSLFPSQTPGSSSPLHSPSKGLKSSKTALSRSGDTQRCTSELISSSCLAQQRSDGTLKTDRSPRRQDAPKGASSQSHPSTQERVSTRSGPVNSDDLLQPFSQKLSDGRLEASTEPGRIDPNRPRQQSNRYERSVDDAELYTSKNFTDEGKLVDFTVVPSHIDFVAAAKEDNLSNGPVMLLRPRDDFRKSVNGFAPVYISDMTGDTDVAFVRKGEHSAVPTAPNNTAEKDAKRGATVLVQEKRCLSEEDRLDACTEATKRRRREGIESVSLKHVYPTVGSKGTSAPRGFAKPMREPDVLDGLRDPPEPFSADTNLLTSASQSSGVRDIRRCVSQLVSVALLCVNQNGSVEERKRQLRQKLRSICYSHPRKSLEYYPNLNGIAPEQKAEDNPEPVAASSISLPTEDTDAFGEQVMSVEEQNLVCVLESHVQSAGSKNGTIRTDNARREECHSTSQTEAHSGIKVEAVRGIHFIFARWKLSLSRQERPLQRIALEAKNIADICAALRSPMVGNVCVLDVDIPRYFKELDAAAHPILFLVGELTAGMEKRNCTSAREMSSQESTKGDVKTALLALRDILEWVRILVDRMLGMYNSHKGRPDCASAYAFCDLLWSSLFINENNIIPALRKAKKSFPYAEEDSDGRIYFSRRKRIGKEIHSLTRCMKEVYVWCQATVERRRAAEKNSNICHSPEPLDVFLANDENGSRSVELMNSLACTIEIESRPPDTATIWTENVVDLVDWNAGEGSFPTIPSGNEGSAILADVAAKDAVHGCSSTNQQPEAHEVTGTLAEEVRSQKKVLWDLRRDEGSRALVENGDMLQFLFEDGENLLGSVDKFQMEAVADRAAMVSRGCVHSLYGWLRVHCSNLEKLVLNKSRHVPAWINLGMTPTELRELKSRTMVDVNHC